jgi:hypothetical protein
MHEIAQLVLVAIVTAATAFRFRHSIASTSLVWLAVIALVSWACVWAAWRPGSLTLLHLIVVMCAGFVAVVTTLALLFAALFRWIANRPTTLPAVPEEFDISRYARNRHYSAAPFSAILSAIGLFSKVVIGFALIAFVALVIVGFMSGR